MRPLWPGSVTRPAARGALPKARPRRAARRRRERRPRRNARPRRRGRCRRSVAADRDRAGRRGVHADGCGLRALRRAAVHLRLRLPVREMLPPSRAARLGRGPRLPRKAVRRLHVTQHRHVSPRGSRRGAHRPPPPPRRRRRPRRRCSSEPPRSLRSPRPERVSRSSRSSSPTSSIMEPAGEGASSTSASTTASPSSSKPQSILTAARSGRRAEERSGTLLDGEVGAGERRCRHGNGVAVPCFHVVDEGALAVQDVERHVGVVVATSGPRGACHDRVFERRAARRAPPTPVERMMPVPWQCGQARSSPRARRRAGAGATSRAGRNG